MEKIDYGGNNIKQCNYNLMNHTGKYVNLVAFNNGKLDVIKNKVGKVIKSYANGLEIEFNETFGYDDKLYILIGKSSNSLSIAYKMA